MICIELAFTDSQQRLAARPAHRANLEDLQRAGLLLAAGPWADDSGAMILLHTDQAAAEEIIAHDPYFDTAGVTVVSVRRWDPVVGP